MKKRENILNYALSEFGTVGYEAVSVRKIADKANMSVGSLYQYFSNKQGMLAVVIEHIFVILNEYIDEIKTSPLILESRLEPCSI